MCGLNPKCQSGLLRSALHCHHCHFGGTPLPKSLVLRNWSNDAYNDFPLVQLGCLRWERLKSCLSARVYYQLALLVPSPKLPERTNPSSVPFKAPAWRPGYKTSCHTLDGYLVPHRLMESRVQNAQFQPESHSDGMLLSIMKQAEKRSIDYQLDYNVCFYVTTFYSGIRSLIAFFFY